MQRTGVATRSRRSRRVLRIVGPTTTRRSRLSAPPFAGLAVGSSDVATTSGRRHWTSPYHHPGTTDTYVGGTAPTSTWRGQQSGRRLLRSSTVQPTSGLRSHIRPELNLSPTPEPSPVDGKGQRLRIRSAARPGPASCENAERRLRSVAGLAETTPTASFGAPCPPTGRASWPLPPDGSDERAALHGSASIACLKGVSNDSRG